jgi:OmpA-OmpF porin, OOP family
MMRFISLLSVLVFTACQVAPPVAAIPPPDADSSGPSPVVSAPPPPNRGNMSERRVLFTINFAFDSYRMLPESYAVIDSIASALQDERMNGSFAEINGHTDVIGHFGYNMGLSYLRASAVMSALLSRGVPSSMMRAQGFGPLQLLNPSFPADPANRRVEVVAVGP